MTRAERRARAVAHEPERASAAAFERELLAKASHLLRAAGLPSAAPALVPLPGGANNRVYRLDAAGAPPCILKAYYWHPDDPRDRLGAEFAFASFAWEAGVRALPRPLARDAEARLGLYERVPGRALAAGDVRSAHVREALAFWRAVDAHRSSPAASAIPDASEACFSLAGHVSRVDARVRRLAGALAPPAGGAGDAGREAARFVRDELAPSWRLVVERARARARLAKQPWDEPLGARDRCLSPSDFGFHNAIVREDGSLCFIDFEYAGWDDPAKMACDFFLQPKVPAPHDEKAAFAGAVAASFADPDRHLARVALLEPVLRIKWCCILLNEFVPADARRRGFAAEPALVLAARSAQLDKARRALACVDR